MRAFALSARLSQAWRVPAFIAALLFLSCLGDKVAGGSSSTETGSEIRLSGRVVDGDNKGVAGVVVTLSRVGLTDTTDSQGAYKVEGSYDSSKTTSGILDTLVFTQDDNEVASLPVTKWVDNLPDLKIVQRDISGKLLPSPHGVSRVEAVISGEGIPEDRPVVIELFLFPLSNSYTGFAYFRGTAAIVDYAVYVRVLDSLGRMTGRSPLVAFRSNAGNIPVPDFQPGNAIPKALAGRDTSLSVNKPLLLRGAAVDSFGGTIQKWEWNIGGSGFIETSSGDSLVTLPSVRTAAYPCILRVTDDDGNTALDTMIVTVTNGNPVVTGMRDTTVSINDSVTFTVAATDPEGIRRYLWDMNGDGVFEDSTLTNVRGYRYPAMPGIVRSVVRVEDNFDGITLDTAIVNVVLDKPVPSIQGASSVKVNVPIQLTAQVTQQFGTIVMYKWDNGKGFGWDDSSSSMTQASFTYAAKGDYTVRLYVRDDDGNVDSTTKVVTVTNDNPVVSGMRDTTVSINDSINMVFVVAASDPEDIKWYLWDMDGDGVNEDTTLTNTKAFSFSSSVPVTRRVIVTVWDNFDGVTQDTGIITVIQDPPVPTIQGPATIKVGVPANFTSQVAQQFGHVVMYKWDDGKGGGWIDSGAALDEVTFIYQAKGDYIVRLYVRDDDGNMGITTLNLTVWNDNPVVSGMRDTVVNPNDVVSMIFTVAATDPDGIKWYLWDLDGDGVNEDTTLTNNRDFSFSSPVPTTNKVIVTIHDNYDGVTKDTANIGVLRGASWTVRKSSGAYLSSVTWTGDLFVAVGLSGTILTSSDGITWTARTSESPTNFKSLAWTGSKVVAVGFDFNSRTIYTSSDGVSWTSQITPSSVSLNSVIWTGNQLVAVGNSGCVLTSPDGETWTVQTSGTSSHLSSVVWTGSRLLAGGPGHGEIVGTLTSPDGVTWTQYSEAISPSFVSTAWNGNWHVGVGFNFHYNNSAITGTNNGVIRISSNGADWNIQHVSPASTFVIWGGNQFVAVGDNGSIRVSLHGLAWLEINSGTTEDLRSVVWNGTRYVAVGANGTILTSP